jgi:uncharacterized protein YndB with AHSA1/START domain
MSTFVRTAETDIAASAEEVYAYLADLSRHPEWADQPMTVEHVSGPASGPGATYRTHVDIDLPVGHKKEDATVVVVDAVAAKRVAFEATGSDGHYRWTIDLTAQGATTHVEQRVERLDGPVWIKVVQPLMWKALGAKMVDNGLANLKDRVERPGT